MPADFWPLDFLFSGFFCDPAKDGGPARAGNGPSGNMSQANPCKRCARVYLDNLKSCEGCVRERKGHRAGRWLDAEDAALNKIKFGAVNLMERAGAGPARTDGDVLGDEMKQRRSIDHVAGHFGTIGR